MTSLASLHRPLVPHLRLALLLAPQLEHRPRQLDHRPLRLYHLLRQSDHLPHLLHRLGHPRQQFKLHRPSPLPPKLRQRALLQQPHLLQPFAMASDTTENRLNPS